MAITVCYNLLSINIICNVRAIAIHLIVDNCCANNSLGYLIYYLKA